jgi:hypothetical protein
MPKYRWLTITHPDGTRVRTLVENRDVNPELLRLQMMYGLKFKLGQYLNPPDSAYLGRVRTQRIACSRGAAPCRPLSPDMGRGSGGPV